MEEPTVTAITESPGKQMVVLIIRLQKFHAVRNGTNIMNLQMELTPTTQIAVKFLIKETF